VVEKEVQHVTRDLESGSAPSEKADKPDEAQTEPRDPNLVDWDGPDDPKNPMNWTLQRKLIITSCISIITLLTYVVATLMMLKGHNRLTLAYFFFRPLGSSMFAPGVPQVMRDFKSDNIYLASFVVSVYLLGYSFGPLLIAPLSEMYGRAPLYTACNFLFTIFNVACALAPNKAALIVFRLFAGLAGSCPLTIGAGTLADMIPPERRGAAMSAWALGPLLGPVIGPVGKYWLYR
jgi:MFS family permease